MKQELIMTAAKWGVTALLAALVSWIVAKIKLRKEKKGNEDKALQERFEQLVAKDKMFETALRTMLRQDIINAYDKYIQKGWAKVYVKDNVQEMYECYHALGGNGTITHLVEEFMKLPTQPKE